MESVLNQDADYLRAIALLNPRLALMLAKGQRWAPRSYNIELLWDSPAADNPIEIHLAERLYQDCWLSDFVYTVDAPNVALGSIWKPMIENSYARLCGSFIKLDLDVQGWEPYKITNEATPMAAICSHDQFEGKLLDKAWVITHDQNLNVRATNNRAFDTSPNVPNQIPTIVTLTLNVKELSGCCIRTIPMDEAVCTLPSLNLLPNMEVEVVRAGR